MFLSRSFRIDLYTNGPVGINDSALIYSRANKKVIFRAHYRELNRLLRGVCALTVIVFC